MTELDKKLIDKGVETYFEGEDVLFKVKSLTKHYSWLMLFHDTFKKIKIGKYKSDFVKSENVAFRSAIPNNIKTKTSIVKVKSNKNYEIRTINCQESKASF